MRFMHQWKVLAVMMLCCTTGVQAAGVLERVRSGGALVIAHSESSVPFSYVDGGKPVGYAVDLCLRLADLVREKTGAKDMPVKWLQVTSADRLEAIKSGKADLECGSTTNNAERRKDVAFTVPHFITGARLLVAATSAVTGLEDMQGKRLVSTKGSTPLKAAERARRERYTQIQILEAPDHEAAVIMVEKGQADAFLMDDVLLYALASKRPDPQAFKVVGRFVTTEPLAIMLPKDDPEFKALVDQEMRRLVLSGEIHAIYDKWFMRPIPPNNRALNLPESYLLRDFWKYPTDRVPF